MQIHEKKLDTTLSYPFDMYYSLDEILFFDIETTGLSSKMSYLYLIGCIYFKEEDPYLIQWFADGIEDEKELLVQFFSFMKNYKVLIHYNGTGFDIPFLLDKCGRYQLQYSFDAITSLDIYKELLPIRKLLPLDRLKQRSVEEFLGIIREDTFSGGELIQVYGQYVGIKRYESLRESNNKYKVEQNSGLPSAVSSSEALQYVLLLHNADDLKGLLQISCMLAYRDFFQGQIDLYDYEITETGLCFLFQLNMPLPKPLHIHKSILTSDPTKTSNANECVINCKVKERHGSIIIPFYYGVLKHFFENYKDYYYLPLEDTAVHKSVAEYVEKDYRKKATKDTCYIKKDGVFLPQLDKTRTPEFQLAFKDKIYWFESTLLINSSEPKKDLKEYFNQIITYVVSKT